MVEKQGGSPVRPVVCTAVAGGRPALARVLADGLRRVHPDWGFTVLQLGGAAAEAAGKPFDAVEVEALDLSEPGLLELLARSPRGLGAALRPALMAWLSERNEGPIVWIDPTVRVLGPLDSLAAAARGGLALVPLHARPEPLHGLRVRGPFESGLVASDDPALLRWWSDLVVDEALHAGASFDPLAGHALSAMIGASEPVRVVRDRALCAGWWTLAAGGRLDGEPPTLDGDRLAALNLAGFDPARPHWLSGEDPQGRMRVSEMPALVRLLETHSRELLAAGWELDAGPWPYRELPGGVPVDGDLRDLFALACREDVPLADPFSESGADAFLDWVDSESPLGAGVTWYLERVHRRRPDLQAAFPDLAGGDGRRLAVWMEQHGRREEPVLGALLERRSVPAAPTVTAGEPGASVRLVGYLNDGLGLGEAARSYVKALRAAGVEVEGVSVPAPIERGGERFQRRREVRWDAPSVSADGAILEIVCMNPPELLRASQAGMPRPEHCYRIGVWAWELDAMPAGWAEAFALVDEVWVYSEHVAAALRPVATVPVHVAPLAVEIPTAEPPVRPEGGPFTFLFAFDLLSTVDRKNPLGLIEAFRTAFGPEEGARLLLKTSNGDNEPEQLERVRVAAVGRPDIEVVDEFVTADERDALIAGCDCYVSLHRAEGFGLTLAEAMAAGRPVIATAFSGNLDFMTEATAYLVGWSPGQVAADGPIYPAGARWAEPDLGEAAALMREVYEDPEGARARGATAREHVARALAPDVVGQALRQRIDEIVNAQAGRRAGGIKATLRRRRT